MIVILPQRTRSVLYNSCGHLDNLQCGMNVDVKSVHKDFKIISMITSLKGFHINVHVQLDFYFFFTVVLLRFTDVNHDR